MELIRQNANVKCDVGNCVNKAEFSVVPENVSGRQYINVCEHCMREMYDEFAKQIVPKSPKNFLAKDCRKTF
ncbi:MAG: hypothetical protein RSB10_01315 [Clostridia bacterium]